MKSDAFVSMAPQTLEEAFPEVDPGLIPLGGRVLVQLRRTQEVTKGGIMLVADTRDTVKWNSTTAKLIAVGPLAFRNRSTAEQWPEGAWAEKGEFVRVPRWGGDRLEIPVPGDESGTPVTIVVLNDTELIAKVTGDVLAHKAYIL
jgi:co-chaperonin GroES (HSP10)